MFQKFLNVVSVHSQVLVSFWIPDAVEPRMAIHPSVCDLCGVKKALQPPSEEKPPTTPGALVPFLASEVSRDHIRGKQ